MGRIKTKTDWVNKPDKEAKVTPLDGGASHSEFNINLVKANFTLEVGDIVIINDTGSTSAAVEPVTVKFDGEPRINRELVEWKVTDQSNISYYLIVDEKFGPVSDKIIVEYNKENYEYTYKRLGEKIEEGHTYYIQAVGYDGSTYNSEKVSV